MTTPQHPVQSSDGAILSQILLKQGEMGVQLAVIQKTLEAVGDHEARIRKLEAWRYGLPVTGMVSLASLITAAWGLLHR